MPQRGQVPLLPAAESGTLSFHTLDGRLERSGNSGPGVIEVPAVSVDDLTAQHGPPDVLFVDIEGAEGEALRGAASTLATTPDCFVEVHVEWLGAWGDTVDAILNFFEKNRYDRFVASEGEPEFTRLENAAHLLGQRFFLVAIAKKKDSPDIALSPSSPFWLDIPTTPRGSRNEPTGFLVGDRSGQRAQLPPAAYSPVARGGWVGVGR